MSRYVPERGDIAWIDFGPALVLSPKAYNAAANRAVVCPITRKQKGYPFEVPLPPQCLVEGVVMSDQAQSVAWGPRRAEHAGSVPAATLDEVLARIAALLR